MRSREGFLKDGKYDFTVTDGKYQIEKNYLEERVFHCIWFCSTIWFPSSPLNFRLNFAFSCQLPPYTPSVQFSSVAQSCPTLCDPINCSMPGLPVHHQFLEFTKTHVHRVGDAIQPSHPLSSPSPPAPNPSQHQSLFQ